MLIVDVTTEEANQLKQALINFVVRVSSAEKQPTEAEINALPHIASLLLDSNG